MKKASLALAVALALSGCAAASVAGNTAIGAGQVALGAGQVALGAADLVF